MKRCLSTQSAQRIPLPWPVVGQVRELIRQRDADGLTFVMHAANHKGGTSRGWGSKRRNSSERDLREPNESQVADGNKENQEKEDYNDFAIAATLGLDLDREKNRLDEEERVDHAVPVLKAAINFIRESLWKEEVGSMLLGRSISALEIYERGLTCAP